MKGEIINPGVYILPDDEFPPSTFLKDVFLVFYISFFLNFLPTFEIPKFFSHPLLVEYILLLFSYHGTKMYTELSLTFLLSPILAPPRMSRRTPWEDGPLLSWRPPRSVSDVPEPLYWCGTPWCRARDQDACARAQPSLCRAAFFVFGRPLLLWEEVPGTHHSASEYVIIDILIFFSLF